MLPTIKSVQIRAVIEGFQAGGDRAWRGALQTLLVGLGCGETLGLLPGLMVHYPGSPR
jgi:hypothetical protein